MKKLTLMILLLLVFHTLIFSENVNIKPIAEQTEDNKITLTLNFSVANGVFLYAEKIKFNLINPSDFIVDEITINTPKEKNDPFTKKKVLVFDNTFAKKYSLISNKNAQSISFNILYQGCTESICFLPQQKNFSIPLKNKNILPPTDLKTNSPEKSLTKTSIQNEFKIKKMIVGYHNPEDFIQKLKNDFNDDDIKTKGLIGILIILLSGLALNLTPCVLPMIPITISIIGAGIKAGSKLKGFFIGLIYASGVAIAYGLLGVFTVLTGSTFGAVNSSATFNFIISIIFIFLSLSMFGVFTIDFTRFQPQIADNKKHKSLTIVFIMGIITAILSGACVAPVIISVLLYSSKLYAAGNKYGLILPFILGIGMGMPWPFLGTGLSFLPKPGSWMKYVKNIFAIIILLFSLYYANLAYHLFINTKNPKTIVGNSSGKWLNSLEEAFKKASVKNKPILIDFWASWCKSCLLMDKTTFKDHNVINELNNYILVKIQAEKPNDKETKQLLNRFGVKGLPSVVIIEKIN